MWNMWNPGDSNLSQSQVPSDVRPLRDTGWRTLNNTHTKSFVLRKDWDAAICVLYCLREQCRPGAKQLTVRPKRDTRQQFRPKREK